MNPNFRIPNLGIRNFLPNLVKLVFASAHTLYLQQLSSVRCPRRLTPNVFPWPERAHSVVRSRERPQRGRRRRLKKKKMKMTEVMVVVTVVVVVCFFPFLSSFLQVGEVEKKGKGRRRIEEGDKQDRENEMGFI